MEIKMLNKKAQKAIEFLMIYGWAILVVLAAIGALAYFVYLPELLKENKCFCSNVNMTFYNKVEINSIKFIECSISTENIRFDQSPYIYTEYKNNLFICKNNTMLLIE